MVRYHPDEVDRFIELADLVEEAMPKVMVDGEEDESSCSSAMVFEVSDEQGRVIFSAQQQHRFPEAVDIIRAIRAGDGS